MRLHFSKYRFSTKIFSEVIIIVFTRMARLDAFFADKHFSYFSRVRLPGYYTFSENLEKKYPGFRLNDTTGFIESGSMPEINLDVLFALLRSRDLSQYEKVRHRFFTGQALFTSGTSIEQPSVAYLTYPRSGNSLMRKYFENLTGVATGSDMVMKF
jgi:hypothetical protein